MKESNIKIKIELDENKVPEKLLWSAESEGIKNQKADAFFLSLWDKDKKNSLRIDLWTKDMKIDEMKVFFHQILFSMAETYERATNDEKMSKKIIEFSRFFGEELKLYNVKKNQD